MGYEAYSFHKACNGKAPALVVILNEFGKIFGGFTTVPWKSTENWKCEAEKDARMFSFDRREVYEQNGETDKAVCFHEEFGPAFGYYDDLKISNVCQWNSESSHEHETQDIRHGWD